MTRFDYAIAVLGAALLALAAAIMPASAAERDYQAVWCREQGGVMEYRLSDGARVDCLTATHAVEFDFGHKWAEAIGQSLYYSIKTGKQPGIVLIITPGEGRFLRRLYKVADPHGITVWTVPLSPAPSAPVTTLTGPEKQSP